MYSICSITVELDRVGFDALGFSNFCGRGRGIGI